MTELKLSGLVKSAPDGTLVARNRLYQSVFDQAWVKEELAKGERFRRPALLASVAVAAASLLALLAQTLYFGPAEKDAPYYCNRQRAQRASAAQRLVDPRTRQEEVPALVGQLGKLSERLQLGKLSKWLRPDHAESEAGQGAGLLLDALVNPLDLRNPDLARATARRWDAFASGFGVMVQLLDEPSFLRSLDRLLDALGNQQTADADRRVAEELSKRGPDDNALTGLIYAGRATAVNAAMDRLVAGAPEASRREIMARLTKAIEETPGTSADRLGRLGNALAKLAAALDSAQAVPFVSRGAASLVQAMGKGSLASDDANLRDALRSLVTRLEAATGIEPV